jgi:hypothetical protein
LPLKKQKSIDRIMKLLNIPTSFPWLLLKRMANSHNVQPTEYKRTRNQKIIFKKKRQAHCAQISPSLVDFIAPCIQKGVRV